MRSTGASLSVKYFWTRSLGFKFGSYVNLSIDWFSLYVDSKRAVTVLFLQEAKIGTALKKIAETWTGDNAHMLEFGKHEATGVTLIHATEEVWILCFFP